MAWYRDRSGLQFVDGHRRSHHADLGIEISTTTSFLPETSGKGRELWASDGTRFDTPREDPTTYSPSKMLGPSRGVSCPALPGPASRRAEKASYPW